MLQFALNHDRCIALGEIMTQSGNDALRSLPAVDRILHDPRLQSLIQDLGRDWVADGVRTVVDTVRRTVLQEERVTHTADSLYTEIVECTLAVLASGRRSAYRRVINATGIILHTGLGRAVLAPRALQQLQAEMSGYSLLQLDPETGKRSQRDSAIETLLQKLTGCEAATVVNNNAAATALVLNTVAQGREVIVSRGQLVEIGGAFRLPDVMAFSGATLVEVGTTNKTHARDYVQAITENTAAILRVHPSNYKIMGFSAEVPLAELVDIAHAHNLVLIDDIGAGSLVDLSRFGFEPEPTLPESVAAGADLITSSGDKLIGASQGGVILGRAPWIQAIRKNQFARIVRADKLTLTVLEATLKLFLDSDKALEEVPTLRMIVRSADSLAEQAARIADALRARCRDIEIRTLPGCSQTGSGSLPTQNLPTTCIALQPREVRVDALSQRLRTGDPPIFARIQEGQLLLDPRTLQEHDESDLIETLAAHLG